MVSWRMHFCLLFATRNHKWPVWFVLSLPLWYYQDYRLCLFTGLVLNAWINIKLFHLKLNSGILLIIFKYLVIQFMGWVFNAKEQASTYGFIVFLINKVIALVLLPLLLLLAFSSDYMQEVVLTIAACVVILLLIFRYIISLTIIRGALSVHPLHFFIYLIKFIFI